MWYPGVSSVLQVCECLDFPKHQAFWSCSGSWISFRSGWCWKCCWKTFEQALSSKPFLAVKSYTTLIRASTDWGPCFLHLLPWGPSRDCMTLQQSWSKSSRSVKLWKGIPLHLEVGRWVKKRERSHILKFISCYMCRFTWSFWHFGSKHNQVKSIIFSTYQS